MAHILGHATVRTMQFLRAPSMLHDYHQMHSAIGGEISPTGKQFEDLLPERVQLWLYRWAFDRGHLDTILDRWVIDPLLQVSRLFAKLDRIGMPRDCRSGPAKWRDFHCRVLPDRGATNVRACMDSQCAVSHRRFAIAVPWFAAVLVAVYRRHTRVIGFLAALVSVVASALLLWEAPKGESLYQALDAAVFLPHSGRDSAASAPRLQRRDDRRNPRPPGLDAAGLLDRKLCWFCWPPGFCPPSPSCPAAVVPRRHMAPAGWPAALEYRPRAGHRAHRGQAATRFRSIA